MGNEAKGKRDKINQSCPGCSGLVLKLHTGSPTCPQPQDSDKLGRIQNRVPKMINGLDGLIYEER